MEGDQPREDQSCHNLATLWFRTVLYAPFDTPHVNKWIFSERTYAHCYVQHSPSVFRLGLSWGGPQTKMFLTVAKNARYPYKYTTDTPIIDDRDDSHRRGSTTYTHASKKHGGTTPLARQTDPTSGECTSMEIKLRQSQV